MSSGFSRTGRPNVGEARTIIHRPAAPNLDATLTHKNDVPVSDPTSIARASGYTGAVCDICGSSRMRTAGHCMVCEECGTTTGCS